MKIRCTNVLFLLLFCLSHSVAQVWDRDYLIQSQAEADEFMSRCNCAVIDGDLIIEGNDIIQLDSLYILKEVKGSVVINNNTV